MSLIKKFWKRSFNQKENFWKEELYVTKNS